jgi:two-component sensor histidine kinase
LSQYIPPSLLIDEQRRVLHYFGAITDYLKAPSGRPDDDVLSLLEDNLALALSTTLRRVEANHPVMTRSIPTKTVQGEQLIDLLVQWLPNSRTGRSHYHIAIFQTRAHAADESAPDTNTEVISFQSQGETHTRIADLELELQYIHESLQATIEELQTSNEELQATNQELLAANEELQSTNEELQSVNEELFTVNAEFEAKNQELRESNQDLDNLLRSIRVGIVFMDRRLRIRKFNPAIAGFFDLLPQDIGRPIEHIAYHLPGQQEMMAEVRQMIATGVPSEQELQTLDSRWFLRRILPFTTDTNTIEGAVLSFTDVSSIKLAEEAARISEQRYRGALESSLDLFMLLEAVHDASDEIIDFRFIELNQPALDHMQMERTEVIGQLLCQLFPLNRTDPLLFPEYMRVAETGKPIIRELRDFNNQMNVSRWFYQQVVKAGDGIAVTSSDITDYKNAEAALLASLREKEVLLKEIHHRVKNNLQIIGSLLNIHIDMVESPDIQHTLQVVKARVQSMAMLHDQIYNSDNLANIQFEPYARQLADTLLQTLSEPDKLITVQVDSDPITLTLDQGVSIGLLLNEFLLNALKHAFPERHTGSIQVTLRAMPDDWGVLIVADDGVGLPPPGAGNERRGVGSEIIEAIIAQLRGTIERKSENGLQITVQFPGLKLESVLQQDPVL